MDEVQPESASSGMAPEIKRRDAATAGLGSRRILGMRVDATSYGECADAVLEMAESGALIANETRLHGNTGISPDARARMTPAPGSARKCRFDFEPPDTRSPFKTELGGSPVTPMPGGGYLDLNKT